MRILIASLTALTLLGCRISANFHEVDAGKLYRSAQLTGKEFERAIRTLGIKTIVNLRGARHSHDWYQEEKAVAARFQIQHHDIGMSAIRIPRRRDLIRLLDIYKDAPRPILIHCAGGADRSGEAAAIYQMEYMGKTKFEALKMLTPKYYHFEEIMPAKRYFVYQYLGEKWAREQYDPCDGAYRFDEASCR